MFHAEIGGSMQTVRLVTRVRHRREIVGIGIDSCVQPAALVGELNHGFVEGNVSQSLVVSRL